jgi:hypothetical protein
MASALRLEYAGGNRNVTILGLTPMKLVSSLISRRKAASEVSANLILPPGMP